MLTLALLQFVMQHPDAVANGVNRLTAPGAVDERALAGSIPDVSREILTCYHKSARMQTVEIAPTAFRDAPQYGADGSVLLRIHYTGFTQARYYMTVALLAKGTSDQGELRAVILEDTARIPYARGCLLQDWTPVSG